MRRDIFDKLVAKVYYISGYNLPDKQIFYAVTEFVYNSIGERYSDQEIEYVIDSGLKKRYGEYTGISAILINDWFSKFQKSDIREKLFPKLKLEAKNKPTPEEKYEILKTGVINAFNEYKELGRYEDKLNLCYDFLDSYGYINLTYELKMKYWDMASVFLKNKASVDKLDKNISEARFSELMEEIKSGKSDAQAVQAKKIAIEEFFKGLVKTDTDITDILNED